MSPAQPAPSADKAGALYCEYSGTSMAAPHVSGAIAAFLSIRNEYIGEAGKGEGHLCKICHRPAPGKVFSRRRPY
ncbi:MAG: S8 family serine peptidase [Candidatus Moraniibacteriota bacterium]